MSVQPPGQIVAVASMGFVLMTLHAFAQTAPQMTLVELLTEGYEIKATMIVPADIVAAGGHVAVPGVMILLQKRAVVANCYFTYESFVSGALLRGRVLCAQENERHQPCQPTSGVTDVRSPPRR